MLEATSNESGENMETRIDTSTGTVQDSSGSMTPAITADAASLIRALQNVALFASTDSTMPSICCLHLTAADGTLTAEATDRYVAAQQTLEASGALDILIPAKDTLTAIKPLTAAIRAAGKSLGYMAEQPSITVTADNHYARFTLTGHLAPDLSVTVALGSGEFPRMARLWPADEDEHTDGCTGHAAFTSANLAKLTKVTAEDKNTPIRFAFSTPRKPAVARIGETFRAVIAAYRIS